MARMWLSAACAQGGQSIKEYTNAIIAGDINRLAFALHGGGLRGIDGNNGGNTFMASILQITGRSPWRRHLLQLEAGYLDDDGRRPVLEPCAHVGPINIQNGDQQ